MQVQVLTGLLLAFYVAAGPAQSADFPVTKFGAVADDAVPDTAAIQAAIDACGAADGGRVLFPRGTCLSGTIRLRSGIELHFPEGARLQGVKDLDAYAGFLAAEGTPKLPQSHWHRGLLVGENLRDVAFTGHDLRLLPRAFDHARRGRRIINQNIILSLLIITALLPLALFGVLGLAAVVLVHEIAEVIVILNGLRAASTRKAST